MSGDDTFGGRGGFGPRGSVDLVPFLCGVAGREELPGPVLVRLLTDLGVTTAAARTLLARMRSRGGLVTTREGRMSSYRLSGVTLDTFRRVRVADAEPAGWDGLFHGVLYTVPEDRRAFRDALRRLALFSGYGPLRPGLLVSPYDRWSTFAEILTDLPEGARVYPVQLRLEPGDARAVVAEAWNLDSLARNYRKHVDAIQQRLRSYPDRLPATAATLRTYAALLRPTFAILVADPKLPTELYPSDWPKGEVVEAIHATSDRFQEPARRYIDGLLAGARG